MTIELVDCKEPVWQENCEMTWKKHEASFASWLADALVISGYRDKTRSVKVTSGLRATVTSDFGRLMPGENGKVTMSGKGANGASGGACVINLACENGMAAEVMGELPPSVIGTRTENDGSVSWLIYSLQPEVDEFFDVGVHTTDGVNDNDHIVSVSLLCSHGEFLMFRRQILLSEKRSFSWKLKRGWNFISTPLLGETLNVLGSCHVIFWNGDRYSDTMDLRASDFSPCRAFWVYSPMTQRMSLDGRMGIGAPTLMRGWNAVGSLYSRVLDDSVYTTDGNNSYYTNIMLPGLGYWIFIR
jgi:hypothetical protein